MRIRSFKKIFLSWMAPIFPPLLFLKCCTLSWTLTLKWPLLLHVLIWLAGPSTCCISCKESRGRQSGDHCLSHPALLLTCSWRRHSAGKSLFIPSGLVLLWSPRPTIWNLHHQHHRTSDERLCRAHLETTGARTESAPQDWQWQRGVGCLRTAPWLLPI